MNSVVKYGPNYLISSRPLHAAILVNGTNGSPIWILGGKHNMFSDRSEGQATNFQDQHNVRLNGDQVTMFDNYSPPNILGCHTDNCSRGLHIELDFAAMTATFVAEYPHPQGLRAAGRGGYTPLSSGNALIAWGTQPAITEHNAGGKVVMDIQVGRLMSDYIPGQSQPYRAYKMDWKGEPTWGPSIVVEDGSVYVSWNGATEVERWVVLSSNRVDDLDGRRIVVAASERKGFETEIALGRRVRRYVRVAALDCKRKIIGYTAVVDISTGGVVEVEDRPVTSVE